MSCETYETVEGAMVEANPYSGIGCQHFNKKTGDCKIGIEYDKNDRCRCSVGLTFCPSWQQHKRAFNGTRVDEFFVPLHVLKKFGVEDDYEIVSRYNHQNVE